jgi:hypothetical protein
LNIILTRRDTMPMTQFERWLDSEQDQEQARARERQRQLVLEIKLNSQYEATLNTELNCDYSSPSFKTIPVYDAIPQELTEKQLKIYDAMRLEAEIAITDLNLDKLKATSLLKNSMIPLRIIHNQETLMRRWQWLRENLGLFFYKRVMFISTAFQKKHFYDQCLEKLLEMNQSNPAAIDFINLYKNQFLSTARDLIRPDAIHVNTFIYYLNQPEYCTHKVVLKGLHTSRSFKDFKEARFRQLDTINANILTSIFETQLKSQSVKSFFGEFVYNSLKDDLRNLSNLETISTCQNLYLAELTKQYQIQLARNENRLYNSFIYHLKSKLRYITDVAELHEVHQRSLSMYSESAEELIALQKHSDARIAKQEKSSTELNPLNISLEEKYFFVFNEGKNTSSPLLHLAIKQYANASDSTKKAIALECISLLISRGCSPYTKNRFVGEADYQVQFEQNAFEYAAIKPDYEILLVALTYQITRSHFAELIRLKLITTCEKMITVNQRPVFEIFSYNNSRIALLKWVSELVQTLHEASQNFTDVNLIAKVTTFLNEYDFCVATNLKKELENIMRKKNINLLCIEPVNNNRPAPVAAKGGPTL